MAKPPSEESSQQVPGHPGWVWWVGVNGLRYARRLKSSPPKVVGPVAEFTALLGRIRDAEARR